MNHDKLILRGLLLPTCMFFLFVLTLSCEQDDDLLDDDWSDGGLDERGGEKKSGCEGKCSTSCRCGWTELGCKKDGDCQAGLYCEMRPQLGNRCLKIKNGGNTNNDNSNNNSNDNGDCHEFPRGHGKYCSSSCPCGEGEGDCDDNSQCRSGLVCKQQSGTDFCVSSGGGGGGGGGGTNEPGNNNGSEPGNNNAGSGGDLKIIIFSVGSADSTLIVFPTGKTMLVDSASEGACKGKVLPILNQYGIRHLDYYLQTHPHGDHSGGEPVLKNSGHIDSGTKMWNWKTYAYKTQFQLEKTKWFIANAWDKTFNGSGTNENSVAFRMEYNGFVYTAGGDQDDRSQDRFLRDYPNLVQAHVRNTAHHMWGPVSKSFLVKTNPYLFITSCYSRGDLPGNYRSAVSTLEKSGRLKKAVLTGDVGHVAVRASSGSSWNHTFCGNNSSCLINFLR